MRTLISPHCPIKTEITKLKYYKLCWICLRFKINNKQKWSLYIYTHKITMASWRNKVLRWALSQINTKLRHMCWRKWFSSNYTLCCDFALKLISSYALIALLKTLLQINTWSSTTSKILSFIFIWFIFILVNDFYIYPQSCLTTWW